MEGGWIRGGEGPIMVPLTESFSVIPGGAGVGGLGHVGEKYITAYIIRYDAGAGADLIP